MKANKLIELVKNLLAEGVKTAGGTLYKHIEDVAKNVEPDGEDVILGDIVSGETNGREWKVRSLTVKVDDVDHWIAIASSAINNNKFTIGKYEVLADTRNAKKGEFILRAH